MQEVFADEFASLMFQICIQQTPESLILAAGNIIDIGVDDFKIVTLAMMEVTRTSSWKALTKTEYEFMLCQIWDISVPGEVNQKRRRMTQRGDSLWQNLTIDQREVVTDFLFELGMESNDGEILDLAERWHSKSRVEAGDQNNHWQI